MLQLLLCPNGKAWEEGERVGNGVCGGGGGFVWSQQNDEVLLPYSSQN